MQVKRVCQNKRCGITFPARSADVKRGWAKFCSKSCKAVAQEARTGQYATLLRGGQHSGGLEESIDFEGGGWDAHKDSF